MRRKELSTSNKFYFTFYIEKMKYPINSSLSTQGMENTQLYLRIGSLSPLQERGKRLRNTKTIFQIHRLTRWLSLNYKIMQYTNLKSFDYLYMLTEFWIKDWYLRSYKGVRKEWKHDLIKTLQETLAFDTYNYSMHTNRKTKNKKQKTSKPPSS